MCKKSLICCLFVLVTATLANAFVGGDGTLYNPYQISTRAHLQAVNDSLSSNYVLMNDIDLAGITYTQAIIAPDTSAVAGFQGTVFTGSFGGNGFAIKNLTINGANLDYMALFGCIGNTGEVTELAVEDCDILGTNYVGGLVGANYGTNSGCYCTGTITGTSNVGGLDGYSSGLIKSCYAAGEVSGETDTGGLAGECANGTITNSYANVNVNGVNKVGGLVGYCYYNTVTRCYASGAVSGIDIVGGLVGDSYGGTINYCFWDMQTTGQTESQGGTGKSTAEMKTRSIYTDAGWDFADTWAMSPVTSQFGGYPIFQWQDEYTKGTLVIPLVNGWNWISFNVLTVPATLQSVLAGCPTIANSDVIISGDGKNATYFNGAWYGTLTDIRAGMKYRLKVAAGGTLTINGNYVYEGVAINLVEGWNWLGYCLREQKPLADALSLLNLTNSDVIISSDGKNATYYNGVWYGTLTNLVPGKGYMLKVAEAQTFYYAMPFE